MARQAADRVANETGQRRFVAGALGPLPVTARSLPMSTIPDFAPLPSIRFDRLTAIKRALLEGGVDLLIVETIFDTLNAKAALFAIAEAFEETTPFPLIVSGTITDRSGPHF